MNAAFRDQESKQMRRLAQQRWLLLGLAAALAALTVIRG